MHLRGFCFTCGVLALLGLAAHANEEPTKKYVEAMKSLEVAVQGLGQAIDAGDHKAMGRYVNVARPALEVVESYWRERRIDDALETARAASKAISEISVCVYLMGISPNPVAVEGAQIAIKSLRTACTTCHTAHRETLPDGSYRIK